MNRNRQQGIALVAVVFLIVVIGAALIVMTRLSVQSNAQVTQSLLQARAKQAAQAGIEWGVQTLQEMTTPDCGPPFGGEINVPAYSNYTVTVTCTVSTYNFTQQIELFRLTATAQFGNSTNDVDYVWTTLDTVVEY